ncbi:MAG: hypothetical protein HY657_13235 [Acidobacteria bacterium]|nr:hypothetical protein [Acidobacteriota bacterium]
MVKVTGPGAMFDSSPAQWPGRDMKHYNYVANEYFVSGAANGQPYTTRLVIRQPADNARFSGLIVAESMHPIGAAHAFEYNSVYIMDSGHVAAEIATAGTAQFAQVNAERYGRIQVANGQASEILAQVGALVRSSQGPLAGLAVRKMVLWGTSASSGTLVSYLPAHRVYRTPDMQRIYDGFMPTSNGGAIAPVDVPIIQVPTQHEYERVATSQQDGDEPGSQFRVYEFAGLGHLDSRNNVRLQQSQCAQPLSRFPLEAYMSVALHHLLRWVDTGVAPPRADRVLIDRNTLNDGSLMILDEHGNARGGIRNPYVEVPIAKYTARNTPVAAAGEGGRAGGAAGAGPGGGGRGGFGGGGLCGLSVYQTAFDQAKLRQLYRNKNTYVQRFEQRLTELEKAGWSLPVYHDLIVADARAVTF